jgi:hypothetical protein
MQHLHNPARLPGESQADYRKRRAASKAHADRITCKGLGNQRRIQSAREALRDKQRANGRGPRGVYGIGLLELQRRRNLKRIADTTPQHLRDEHGTFTLTGAARLVIESPFPARMERRKWLAGISAQRGY